MTALRGRIGHFQYLALGFGTIIGSAWVILLGDWLGKAGPGGSVLGFVCGAVVVMTIGACYAELTARLPEAGSEFIYAHRAYGRRLAFCVGWFLVLYLVSVTIFEALVQDPSGSIRVIFFNQPYLRTALPAGRANSSPGWRASGAGWHHEERR